MHESDEHTFKNGNQIKLLKEVHLPPVNLLYPVC